MQHVITTVYNYAELSKGARKRARENIEAEIRSCQEQADCDTRLTIDDVYDWMLNFNIQFTEWGQIWPADMTRFSFLTPAPGTSFKLPVNGYNGVGEFDLEKAIQANQTA